jgi:hypothetical protein
VLQAQGKLEAAQEAFEISAAGPLKEVATSRILRPRVRKRAHRAAASASKVSLTTPEQARQRFEHYELVKGEGETPVELGRGAMGVTYKALDVDLHCPVTLKVISERYLGDESARLRFLREARAAASVRHPNVASVFHLGRTGQNYFYAMEFVEGETLENLLKRSGRLEVKLALEIATQVAAGLSTSRSSFTGTSNQATSW